MKQGEAIYMQQCAACHGEFGESAGRWPILSGGDGTLASHDPVKSIGSYWPYASTVMDYIRRAMPFGNAQSLSNDELYAVTAYVFYLNDIIKDENFELNANTFKTIKLPNEPNFRDDDRDVAEKSLWRKSPCMTNCLPGDGQDHRPRPRHRRDAGAGQGTEGGIAMSGAWATSCLVAAAATFALLPFASRTAALPPATARSANICRPNA